MCVVRYSDGENRERGGGERESDEAIERTKAGSSSPESILKRFVNIEPRLKIR